MSYQLSGYPTGKRVLVLPDEADKTFIRGGRILVAETQKEKPNKGRVIQIGEEVTVCKPGDEILYNKYAGNFVDFDISDDPEKENSKEFLLMLDSDITYVWSCEIKEPEQEVDEEVRDRVRSYNGVTDNLD